MAKKSIWKIALSDIAISKREEQAVKRVLRSKWLSQGQVTLEFENKFKRMHGVRYAVAVANGTAALHLANLALGVGPGDEVICPSLTFVATANSILYTGARVVFADVSDCGNPNISADDIERKISKKTKAVIVVHFAGYPCDMKNILSLAKKYGLAVVEDCAHAPLVRYQGKYLGTYGSLGCFSFFANKNMTTAEGGMVIADDEELARRIRSLRSHGMTSQTWDRHKGHAYSYDVLELGYNYRMDEIRSALGLAQLEQLPTLNVKRRALVKYYIQKLKTISGVELLFQDFHLNESACHIFPILLQNRESRDELQAFLKLSGVQTSIHYPPVHLFSYYKPKLSNHRLPITENIASRILTLPLYPALKKPQIDYIAKKIKEYVEDGC